MTSARRWVFAEFYDTSIRTWSANWPRPSDRTGATVHTWTRPATGTGSASGTGPASGTCPAACTEGAQASAQAWQKGSGSAKGSKKTPTTLIECLELEPLCRNSDE